MESIAKADATPSSIGIRYGLVAGLINVIISFGLHVSHLEDSPVKHLASVVMIGGIVLAQRDFKQQNDGFMSYGQGLGISVLVSAIIGALSAAFTYVYAAFIDPDMVGRAVAKARAALEAKGDLSDAQIERAIAVSAKFTSGPVLWGFIILVSIITGLAISLLTSAIIKNPKPEFE